MLVPVLLLCLAQMVTAALQLFLLFLRDGREAGAWLLCKIFGFYVGAPVLLLVAVCIAMDGLHDRPAAPFEGSAVVLRPSGYLARRS